MSTSKKWCLCFLLLVNFWPCIFQQSAGNWGCAQIQHALYPKSLDCNVLTQEQGRFLKTNNIAVSPSDFWQRTWRSLFKRLGKRLVPICARTVFLNNQTQKGLFTVIYSPGTLTPGFGAAQSHNDRPANIPILRMKIRPSDAPCLKCQ